MDMGHGQSPLLKSRRTGRAGVDDRRRQIDDDKQESLYEWN